MSLVNNVEFLRHLPKMNAFNGLGALAPAVPTPLVETTEFGANPGALKMFSFVPAQLARSPALVVVLHGCGQTAASYDLGTGWSTLAGHYGFALLVPEQQAINNGNTCFNWFNPEDIARGHGEARSIRQMIAHMVSTHQVDPRRVYVTGLSAGGAMASVMLATYPDVFAGGAIIAGLPYGVASNLREALHAMMHASALPAPELGDLVRKASTHKGAWPKISVWHGSADRTVHPANADAIVRQWLDVHGLPLGAMSKSDVDGHAREVWWNADGETLVESYTITNMAHGTPLGLADNDERYGVEGAFLIEAGISSSYHIASFFGLTDRARQPHVAPTGVPRERADTISMTIPVTASEPATAAAPGRRSTRPRKARSRGVDVGRVIARALTAAGLMK
ncbi:PHB depolymerase family esterase [Bradyrhizobium sp. ISRA443]|uniref:extracellular catalytic domain type 1 short-chain-length polyhydroxyalkanoate depolymerase n=1 Tax=unclassified Bradyrhizobium TaxID=2631580 RepID=UPI00247ABB9B|nr:MULTISPECIES: PHB depolymerase family esterase [unclassified Bradyrhizobium]WGR94488.1 PHB depolymerase family esterase [Bradyrhizobium sp. ISRA435]WGR99231.1 PHB depolymerase family esterase [Bradyrhizobium sp. ISRA436]WGS06123.1 PHB depolymerase family esterase [Bradyrhizobium sp. ISRA437]WGS13008.1 PHB depolymerase family esterase [Bradyrhizobium sp. ISRA443]